MVVDGDRPDAGEEPKDVDDCDCYTNDQGFWELGPKCQQAELDEWRAMFERLRNSDILADQGRPRPPRWAHDKRGRVRRIEDTYLLENLDDVE